MKKTILFVLAAGFVMSVSRPESELVSYKDEQMVYVCDSDGATKYHLIDNCRGLNNCKHEIKKMTLKQAEKEGKKDLCGWED